MAGELILRGDPDGVLRIAPVPVSPTPPIPPLDTLVLGVPGGHLFWSLLSENMIPTAVLDDREAAQEWLWALYGADTALAAADLTTGNAETAFRPARPELPTRARRLGYAHWAARWWPASALDGITALDPALLDYEIAELTDSCEGLADDTELPIERPELPVPAARPDDYALAAGTDDGGAPTLRRGTTGWDWRRCPPGLVDASERAVGWSVRRESRHTSVRITAVAAPHLHAPVPAHLWPRATVRTRAGQATIALVLDGDEWSGAAAAPDGAETGVAVELYVPGVGPDAPSEPDAAGMRSRLRDFATDRLARAARGADDPADPPLLAEAAATTESDF